MQDQLISPYERCKIHFCYLTYMLGRVVYNWDKADVFKWFSGKTGGIPFLLYYPNYRVPVLLRQLQIMASFFCQSLERPDECTELCDQCTNTDTQALISLRFIRALAGNCQGEVWDSLSLSFPGLISTFQHSSAGCTNSPWLVSNWSLQSRFSQICTIWIRAWI